MKKKIILGLYPLTLSVLDFPRADYPSNEPWNPCKYETECCGSIIFSPRPGQLKSCKCGEASVDQTREYTRTNGKMKVIEGKHNDHI